MGHSRSHRPQRSTRVPHGTAAPVRRFLCRQSSVTATEKTLTALKRAVAEKEVPVCLWWRFSGMIRQGTYNMN